MKFKFYSFLVVGVIFTFLVRKLSNYHYEKILGQVETENFNLTVGVHSSMECNNGALIKYTPTDIAEDELVLDCLTVDHLEHFMKLLTEAKQEIGRHQ